MKKLMRSAGVKFLAFVGIVVCMVGTVYTGFGMVQSVSQDAKNGKPYYEFDSSFAQTYYIAKRFDRASRLIEQALIGERSEQAAKASLQKEFGGQYYAKLGNRVISNTTADEDAFLSSYIYQVVTDNTVAFNTRFLNGEDGVYIMLAMTKEQAAPYEAQWRTSQDMIIKGLIHVVVFVLLGIVLMVYLLLVAGRKPEDEEVHLMAIDAMCVELNLVLIVIGIAVSSLVGPMLLFGMSDSMAAWMMPIVSIVALSGAFTMALLMSLARNVKNHSIIERSVILRCVRWCWRKVTGACKWLFAKVASGGSRKHQSLSASEQANDERDQHENGLGEKLRAGSQVIGQKLLKGGQAISGAIRTGSQRFGGVRRQTMRRVFRNYEARKVMILFISYTIGIVLLGWSMGWVAYDGDGFAGVIFAIIALSVMVASNFLLRRIDGMDKIVKGLKQLRAGQLDYKVEECPEGVFAQMAEDLNSLAEGMQSAVQNEIRAVQSEVRAERMKSELITNVSHDLKTPLTSILNYADLLCKEHLSPEEANDYAKIIYQKGERLKNLTSDLFDISKVQSGAEEIHCEPLDACTLMRQALAEQQDAFAEAGLTVRTKLPEGEVKIWADGKKMSRVLDNLLSNCKKYAMRGTRVHLAVSCTEQSVILSIKNIANYEMDFDISEITERFVRGEASRTTDGSGLGLAIAKSYVEACGGMLRITVDGDLFKTEIVFSKFLEA